jgi:hypothetical protein
MKYGVVRLCTAFILVAFDISVMYRLSQVMLSQNFWNDRRKEINTRIVFYKFWCPEDFAVKR